MDLVGNGPVLPLETWEGRLCLSWDFQSLMHRLMHFQQLGQHDRIYTRLLQCSRISLCNSHMLDVLHRTLFFSLYIFCIPFLTSDELSVWSEAVQTLVC